MSNPSTSSSIGIDYTPAYEQGGGIGRYVRELVSALAAQDSQTDYRLFVSGARARGKVLPALPGANFAWAASRLSPLTFARMWHWARLPLPVEWWVGRVALYHATDFVLPPTRRGTRTLLTVHDLSFVRAPEAASPALRRYLNKVVPRSVQRADHVLADSQATKDDLVDLYGTSPDKITVLLSGVNARFRRIEDQAALDTLRHKYKIGPEPYILAVGTIQPRKNYERLIRALPMLPEAQRDVQLVIVGGQGWLEEPIYATVRELGLQERVKFLGFADDSDLPTLYSGAACLAFPSLYEGFGLPLLEAMACGTPTLSANGSSLVEVAGDASVLVDPLSLDSIAEGLAHLLADKDLRAVLVERGYAQASRFTWEAAASSLLDIYQLLLKR